MCKRFRKFLKLNMQLPRAKHKRPTHCIMLYKITIFRLICYIMKYSRFNPPPYAIFRFAQSATSSIKSTIIRYNLLTSSTTICYNLLQSAAICCNLLQSAAICHNLLQSATIDCNLPQSATSCYKPLNSAAKICNNQLSRNFKKWIIGTGTKCWVVNMFLMNIISQNCFTICIL